MEDSLQPQYYMKKGRKLWFLLLVTVLVVWLIRQYTSSRIISFIVSITTSFIVNGGWTAILIGYGINNTKKLYSVLFFILAFFQLSQFLYDIIMRFDIAFQLLGGNNANILRVFSSIMFYISGASKYVWIASLLIIFFWKQSSALLKTSSMLLALLMVFSFFRLMSSQLMGRSIGYAILFFALNIFFFASMSFSKVEKPRTGSITDHIGKIGI